MGWYRGEVVSWNVSREKYRNRGGWQADVLVEKLKCAEVGSRVTWGTAAGL